MRIVSRNVAGGYMACVRILAHSGSQRNPNAVEKATATTNVPPRSYLLPAQKPIQ